MRVNLYEMRNKLVTNHLSGRKKIYILQRVEGRTCVVMKGRWEGRKEGERKMIIRRIVGISREGNNKAKKQGGQE